MNAATAQITSRGVDTDPRVEWAYVFYKIGNWDFQVGCKRIPLYFYSDFQAIAVAYSWMAPPSDLYGWEAANYTGANLRYRAPIDGLGVSASVFGGSEHLKDAGIFRLYGTECVDIQWKNLVGADMELNKD